MNKSLQQLADELEESLDVIEQIQTGIICPTCHKVQVLHEDLISMKYTGECTLCDHTRGEQYE